MSMSVANAGRCRTWWRKQPYHHQQQRRMKDTQQRSHRRTSAVSSRIVLILLIILVVVSVNLNIQYSTSIHPRDDEYDDRPPRQVGKTRLVPAAGTINFVRATVKDWTTVPTENLSQPTSTNIANNNSNNSHHHTNVTKQRQKSIIDHHQLDYLLDPNAGWDVSPIVLEEFKLVLFTTPKIATTVWKQLARRMMKYDDWMVVSKSSSSSSSAVSPSLSVLSTKDDTSHDNSTTQSLLTKYVSNQQRNLPHDPASNRLPYLYHYNTMSYYHRDNDDMNNINHSLTVDEILTSPLWTRAIFVRDPIERLVSAYLDKVVQHDHGWYVKHHCCGFTQRRNGSSNVDTTNSNTTRVVKSITTSTDGSISIPISVSSSTSSSSLSSSSSMTIADSFRQRLHIEHRQRLAPGISPGADLPRFCQTLIDDDGSTNYQGRNDNDSDEFNHLLLSTANQHNTTSSSRILSTSTTVIPFDVFVLQFLPVCDDPHWRPQSQRLDRPGSVTKYDALEDINQQRHNVWKYINFVGRFETIEHDAKRLLERVGAWDEYGSNGWSSRRKDANDRRRHGHSSDDGSHGQHGNNDGDSDDDDDDGGGGGAIFAPSSTKALHATDAASHVSTVFGSSSMRVKRAVLDFYNNDYNHPVLKFNSSLYVA